jgi:hypothetical protein
MIMSKVYQGKEDGIDMDGGDALPFKRPLSK